MRFHIAQRVIIIENLFQNTRHHLRPESSAHLNYIAVAQLPSQIRDPAIFAYSVHDNDSRHIVVFTGDFSVTPEPSSLIFCDFSVAYADETNVESHTQTWTVDQGCICLTVFVFTQ